MAARWRIVNDTPSEQLGRDGRFTSVREITFEVIDNGQIGHVSVPLRDYRPETVAAAIQPYADNILAVSQMQGEG